MNISKHLNKRNIMWSCLVILVYFLTHGFSLGGYSHNTEAFSFYGLNHTENQTVLNRLKSEFSGETKTSIPTQFRGSFIRHCQLDIDALTALLPVAANLSEEHFKSWARIVYFVKNFQC